MIRRSLLVASGKGRTSRQTQRGLAGAASAALILAWGSSNVSQKYS